MVLLEAPRGRVRLAGTKEGWLVLTQGNLGEAQRQVALHAKGPHRSLFITRVHLNHSIMHCLSTGRGEWGARTLGRHLR
jgi:hypothetical protein